MESLDLSQPCEQPPTTDAAVEVIDDLIDIVTATLQLLCNGLDTTEFCDDAWEPT